MSLKCFSPCWRDETELEFSVFRCDSAETPFGLSSLIRESVSVERTAARSKPTEPTFETVIELFNDHYAPGTCVNVFQTESLRPALLFN